MPLKCKNSVIFNVGREKLVLEKVGICENTNFGSGDRKTYNFYVINIKVRVTEEMINVSLKW